MTENRIGLDAKPDAVAGLSFESSVYTAKAGVVYQQRMATFKQIKSGNQNIGSIKLCFK